MMNTTDVFIRPSYERRSLGPSVLAPRLDESTLPSPRAYRPCPSLGAWCPTNIWISGTVPGVSQPLHDVRWISAVDHASEPAYYPSTSSIDELVWLETVSQPYAYIIQQLDGDLAEAASAQDPELPSVDRNAVERCLGIVPFILLSLGDLGTLQFAAVGESDGGVNLVVRAPSRGKRLSMIIPPTMVRPIIVMRVDISVGVVTSECHSIQDLPGHLSWLKN